jgi:hypothetical protein
MANWTATIRGLTIGEGTSYPFTQPGITGLGVPATRTADQERGHLSGDVGGDDVMGKRVLTIPLICSAADGTAAWTLLVALKTAWAPSYTDIPFAITFAGVTLTYNGRPRGMDTEMGFLGSGVVPCLLTFEALSPFAIGEPIDVAL